ncbi:molybdopterin-guanine dinucleotide biosynthesis protein B [Photobacterium galatheae]|uniref:molybdopterin-guanine dinucleotide biosynthesis protein B n=1 Tax=Photobacterium galatheae TaxID=1654360 RepID=UPI00056C8E39|nr:molybdopterin-guanine dinucleotide biosynthesis protein B [Photobacterium galatheae]MCM0148210.1 molybdopterin-guanine dinucleotide biosynthesis protein B [Photobacterium galatheae]
MAPVIGFAGFSGSGKTTLIEQIIPFLKQQGLRVGLLKHSHHDVEPDTPGKDSYRLRHAGSDQLLLATPHRHILFFEYPEPAQREPQLDACLQQLDHSQLDIILVEGFRDQPIAKIEIHRPDYGKPLLYPQDEHIIAMATSEPDGNHPLPVLDLNQPEQVAEFILKWSKQ